ncbi:MAG: hypothetical protein E7018_00800 [Alphaproteobacteria bacterium]|nr:hypothetical protein [Alphaproteobacteria bacterium]
MNYFLIRRLAPFFVVSVLVEFVTLALLLSVERSYVDWAIMPMTKTVGILLKTTTISFIFIMVPYVLYLWLMPAKKINTQIDKNITKAIFGIFVFYNLFEETMSLVFWNKFSAAFNMTAIEYLLDMREVASDITQNYLFAAYIVGLLLITRLVVRTFDKYLFVQVPSPHWFKRTVYAMIYLSFCGLIYVNINENELEINENYYNNELSKDGTYSLGRALWKSNINYKELLPLKIKNNNIFSEK